LEPEGAEIHPHQWVVSRSLVRGLSTLAARPSLHHKVAVTTPNPTPLDPTMFGEDSTCFGCSPTHPIGFRLKFQCEGDEVVTRYTPPEQFQGPPGVLHGGLVTTLADEIAAWTIVGLKRRFGFTASLEGRLKKPVRIGEEVTGRGRIVADRGRVVTIGVTLHQQEQLAFDGRFTFAVLDVDAAERLLGTKLPDAWRRFGREDS
jgi:acyl-coenzyme A thioesterase PaaI-like protein